MQKIFSRIFVNNIRQSIRPNKFAFSSVREEIIKPEISGQNQKLSSVREDILRLKTPYGNVTDKIMELTERKIYQNPKHPLGILSSLIQNFYNDPSIFKSENNKKFKKTYSVGADFSPIVTTYQCFDELLIPKDHVSRKKSDTYYINEEYLLKTHTTADEKQMFNKDSEGFLIISDCYRRDEIDSTHYPVFHQMEAVCKFKKSEFPNQSEDMIAKYVIEDLQQTYENLIKYLFGDVQMRWVPAYFPFTEPSLELEIWWNNDWLEVLGCGILRREIMDSFGRPDDEIAWASGIGVERFAMLLFEIPDIRLFWTEDERFMSQFKEGQITKFKPYSKYPTCYKDISFWISNETEFEPNDLFELCRSFGGDLVETVQCIDVFQDKKNKRESQCYRIHYKSWDRTLTNEEIDVIQFKIRDHIESELKCKLR